MKFILDILFRLIIFSTLLSVLAYLIIPRKSSEFYLFFILSLLRQSYDTKINNQLCISSVRSFLGNDKIIDLFDS